MVARAARGLEISVGAGAGQSPGAGGDDAPSKCPLKLQLQDQGFSSDVSFVFDENKVVVTNTAGTQGQGIVFDPIVLVNAGNNIWVAELTIESLTALTDGVVGLAFSSPTLSVFEGFILAPGTGTSADGQYLRASDNAPIGSPVQINLEEEILLIFDGNTGDFSLDDGTNQIFISNMPTFNTENATIMGFVAPPTGLGNEAHFKINGGGEPFVNVLPAGAKAWCELPPAPDAIYELLTLQLVGNAQLLNGNRTINWTTSAGTSSAFSGFAAYALGNNHVFNSETFELELDQIDVDSTFGEWEIGILGGIFQTQLTLEADVINIGSTAAHFEIISDSVADPNFDQSTQVITFHTLAAEDVIACNFDGSEVRLCYEVTGFRAETVFFDPIPIFPGDTSYTSIVQTGQSGVSSGTNTFQTTYNGKDADMAITTYPDTFMDSFDDPMPTKTAPEVKSAVFLRNGVRSVADASFTVDGTGKIMDGFGSFTVVSQMLTTCPVFMRMATGIRVVEVEVTNLTASASIGYTVLLTALNRNDSFILIDVVAGDLSVRLNILGVQTTAIIKAAYTYTAGDVISLEVNTAAGTVRGHVNDGAVSSSSPIAFDDQVLATYMAQAGHNSCPTGELFKITSHYKAADMDAGLKAVYAVGAMDLEGTVI